MLFQEFIITNLFLAAQIVICQLKIEGEKMKFNKASQRE